MKIQMLILSFILFLAGMLRFYQITSVPPGLYIDEISIGRNAYAILTTGKDEYGISFPLEFRSLGDYKMPVYIYFVSVAMTVFGKSELAVRFPSAFFGTATVLLLYIFLKELFRGREQAILAKYAPYLGAFLLAITPWHIGFSRGGFEVTVGAFFFLLACYLFLIFLRKKSLAIIFLSFSMLTVAMYTYHSFRILSLLTVLVFGYILFRTSQLRKKIVVSTLIPILLMVPLILFSFSQNGSSRFAQTTFTSDYQFKYMDEKVTKYPILFLRNYISFYSIDFLFNAGDRNGRHQVPGFGLLYHWEFIFFFIGIYQLIRYQSKRIKSVMMLFFLLAPIPGALAIPSPHSLRNLLLVVPITTCIALGLCACLLRITKKRLLICVLFSVVVLFELLFYIHLYYVHYPRINQLDWGSGYKDMVMVTEKYTSQYKKIIVDNKLVDAQLYFQFYDSTIHITDVVDETWAKPVAWKNEKVLFIRPYYGNKNPPGLVDTVFFSNTNKDIFAQLYSL